MSPGVIVYSGGLTYEAGGNAILHLGLGSSKVTKVKNQKIFDTRNEAEISGVSKGERKKSEWGLSLSSTVPLQHLNKQLHWEFYEHIFVPLQGMNEIRNYNMELNNVNAKNEITKKETEKYQRTYGNRVEPKFSLTKLKLPA